MQSSASVRSALLIAASVLLLGTVATASTPDSVEGQGQPQPVSVESLPPSSAAQLALSRHLQTVGALFYGAWWCPACNRQKSLFGLQGAARLPYVECDREQADRQRCQAAAIKAFPTWELSGKPRLVGVQSLAELSSWSSFSPR